MTKFEKGNTMWKRAARTQGARTATASAGEERADRDAPPSPVVFICNAVPALGLALPTGLYTFERGRLELSHAADIAWVRKLPWYGVRIFEQEGVINSPSYDTPPAVPAATNPASGATLMFRRHLAQDAQGGWRCKDCGEMSPSFPVEGAAIAHLQMIHRIGAHQGGSDHGTQQA